MDTQLLFTNINVLNRDLFNVISQAIYLLAFLILRKSLSAQGSLQYYETTFSITKFTCLHKY